MMKKYFYLPAMAMLAVWSSCSNEDTLSQQQSAPTSSDALVIRPQVKDAMRVAQAYDNSSLSEFRLIATGFFKSPAVADPTNQQVEEGTDVRGFDITLAKSGTSWPLPTTEWANGLYWGDRTTKATFTAIAPKTIVEGEYEVKGASATEDGTDGRATQEDIIVAFNAGQKKDFSAGVPLNFRHVLSRIQFQAVNKDYANGLTVTIKNIKIANVQSKGAFVLPTISTAENFSWANYTPWTSTATPAWYYGTEGNVELNATAQNITFGDDFYLLPQQLTPADTVALKMDPTTANAKQKQYVSFLIQAKYTGTKAIANSNGLVWPYKKVASTPAVTVPEIWNWGDWHRGTKNWPAGKFVDKTTYDAISGLTGFEAAAFTDCTTSDYAWACVPLDTNWEPGKKYIYTLNYSTSGVGYVDPEDGERPGALITPDSPLKLWFTVTVVDWDEITNTENLE